MKNIELTYRLKNISEYKQLLFDLATVGAVENYESEYHKADKDGMSLMSTFHIMDWETLEEYFGAELINNTEFEEYILPSSSEEIKFVEKCRYLTPNEKDFPLILHMHFEDDYDRIGKLSYRQLHFFSIKNTPRYVKKPFPKLHKNWDARYKKEYEELCDYQKKQRAAVESNFMEESDHD